MRRAMQVSMFPEEVDIADRAAVGAAAVGFNLVDDLHGPDLGRAGDGAGRQTGAEGVEGGLARPHSADDVGA